MTLKELAKKYNVEFMFQNSVFTDSVSVIVLGQKGIKYETSFSRISLGPDPNGEMLCHKLDEFLKEKLGEPKQTKLADTGVRKEFESGAVREIVDDKGRCDLLPLGVLSMYLAHDEQPNWVLEYINKYIYGGAINNLYMAMDAFNEQHWKNKKTMILEASRQYADGAKKYDDRNWEKGLPLHCFIDSGVRHYLKFLRGDTDEPHDRAFVWNMLGAAWTHENKPELIDLPFFLKSSSAKITTKITECIGTFDDKAASDDFAPKCGGCIYNNGTSCTSNKMCVMNHVGMYSGYTPKLEKENK